MGKKARRKTMRTRSNRPRAQSAETNIRSTCVSGAAPHAVEPHAVSTVPKELGQAARKSTAVILRTKTQEFKLRSEVTLPTPSALTNSTLFAIRPETKMTLAQAAMQWTYVVRNRGRWSLWPELKQQQAADAQVLLKGLGIDDAALKEIANSSIVQVTIPWTENEGENWPERTLPWEFIIGSATRSERNDKPMTVIRHLDRCIEPKAGKAADQEMKQRVLCVISEPGALKGRYVFNTERGLLWNNLAAANEMGHWEELRSPTKKDLIEKLQAWQPDVVHFAGFDTHQVLSMLSQIEKEEGRKLDYWDSENNPTREATAKDGYVLKGAELMLAAVDVEELAQILENKGRPPRLVVWNFYNSAARIASRAVSRGVESAIGFQDSFDDNLAEQFLAVFYSRLDWSNWNTVSAFQAAWEHVRNQPQQHQGTGVVHWSTRAYLGDQLRPDEPQVTVLPTALLEHDEVRAADVASLISVAVKVANDLNYSMLHNDRPIFSKFTLTPAREWVTKDEKRVHPILHNVTAKVTLDVGASATYLQTFDVGFPCTELSSKICLPLTSSLTRAVHESIRTSMQIEVMWGTHVLSRQTERVRLTPVDQWTDSETDRQWLPSFVYPRDQATSELIDKAQRYVRVLRDDPSAGFDGYQSFNPSLYDPAEEVDLQVQAVWSAIVHEMRLTYINPPPGYSSTLDSQRLRTPTMIRDFRCGTCIDLALFFAACLELVDIYPVIFLLEGHAFPGYWRFDGYHDEFLHPSEGKMSATGGEFAGADVPKGNWLFKEDTRDEILRYVREGKLVPLETVRLTENCGFWEAADAGMNNLSNENELQAMVDIKLARDRLVTPLPILGEQS
jgi:hypothetical protein